MTYDYYDPDEAEMRFEHDMAQLDRIAELERENARLQSQLAEGSQMYHRALERVRELESLVRGFAHCSQKGKCANCEHFRGNDGCGLTLWERMDALGIEEGAMNVIDWEHAPEFSKMDYEELEAHAMKDWYDLAYASKRIEALESLVRDLWCAYRFETASYDSVEKDALRERMRELGIEVGA